MTAARAKDNSENCKSASSVRAAIFKSFPGPSFATGMKHDVANAGGDHEAVTPLALGNLSAGAAIETSSPEETASATLPIIDIPEFLPRRFNTAPTEIVRHLNKNAKQ